MSFPGFIFHSGSQSALNSRNACISSGPNIFSSSAPRACPSPCSPENDPPYDATRSAASSRNARNFAIPASDVRSKFVRVWTQPSPKWP